MIQPGGRPWVEPEAAAISIFRVTNRKKSSVYGPKSTGTEGTFEGTDLHRTFGMSAAAARSCSKKALAVASRPGLAQPCGGWSLLLVALLGPACRLRLLDTDTGA